MASSPTTPMPPAAGPQPPVGASASQGASPAGGTAQKLVRLAMDARQIAQESPETAPMMREVDNQVRMATMKTIQMRQAAQQATPQI